MDDSLSFESFFDGARRAAQKAMEDHGRGEFDEFALHAGVAVERLAKAVLVMRNPLYLVEMRNGNADLLLYFGGDLELDAAKVRTVGAKEALGRLRRMGVLQPDAQLDLLIELRNGTAHTSVGDQARTLLPTLAETTTILLTALGTRFEVFWGRWSRAVVTAVDTQLDEIRRDVEIRIDQARHLFEDRFKDLPEGTMAHVRTASEPDVASPEPVVAAMWLDELPTGGFYFHLATVDCPACKGPATARILPSPAHNIPGTADMLHCGLCHLNLTGQDEVKACGIGNPWQHGRTPRLIVTSGIGPHSHTDPEPTES
ncbi:hypothetical protein [Streptomyces mangrovisoli]|uniref:Uncharacterized protein n=1 Tax=Streptomyces mangrovisoli TaxID=1428628 RepID=A0A1J4P1I6_9ACTN|nr:hypothetical protein [Streptomyces mangrovisoli]OIJ68467.1 hypothetical protein WN71_008625 [Streptomyces mangrovisoli]